MRLGCQVFPSKYQIFFFFKSSWLASFCSVFLLLSKRIKKELICKLVMVAVLKKRSYIILNIKQNLNFLFLPLYFYFFKNFTSQFLSHWESTEPVFLQWGTQLSPYKNQNKSLIWKGILNFCCMLRIIHKRFFHRVTFTR